MQNDKNEMQVLRDSKNLSFMIYKYAEKAPKKYRHTLLQHMQSLSLEIVEQSVKANFYSLSIEGEGKKRIDLHRETLAMLSALDALLVISRELACFGSREHENISKLVASCMKRTSAWLKSDTERFKQLNG